MPVGTLWFSLSREPFRTVRCFLYILCYVCDSGGTATLVSCDSPALCKLFRCEYWASRELLYLCGETIIRITCVAISTFCFGGGAVYGQLCRIADFGRAAEALQMVAGLEDSRLYGSVSGGHAAHRLGSGHRFQKLYRGV